MSQPRRFRAPRRLRIHRSGWTVIFTALGLGVAAMGTGNNLLYLNLGAVLGLIALSGWLSEVTLRRVEVTRRVPRGIEAGSPARLVYEVANAKRLLPSLAFEIGERRQASGGFVAILRPGERASVRVEHVWERRGVHPLEAVTLSTSFPFGLFRKERDLEVPDTVVVWPRTSRPVREPRPASDRAQPSGARTAGASGPRGEYRSLRGYLPGDDPRDVHWRSSARTGEPVVREYASEQAQTLWLCLDLRGGPSEPAAGDGPREAAAVEIAAALAARAARSGQPVGLVTADERVEPGTGPRQLERVLDALARARFRPAAPPPHPPVRASECVLITPGPGGGGADWGDVFPAAEAG